MSLRTCSIEEKQILIKKLQNEIDFLSDSESIYPMSLGNEDKTLVWIDFSQKEGVSFFKSNDLDKLEQGWYYNYSGFLTEEVQEATKIYKRLRAQLALYRVHKYIYPFGPVPVGSPVTYWVIGYDDSNDTFLPIEKAAPFNRSEPYIFENQSDCQDAIEILKGPEQSLDILKSLLAIDPY